MVGNTTLLKEPGTFLQQHYGVLVHRSDGWSHARMTFLVRHGENDTSHPKV